MVSRRLVRKISKGLPFPQGTQRNREDDFDFEKVLDHNRSLESLLTPVLHANALLEAELARETALLEVEESSLKELETNAKTEASLRKEAGRKVHFLLQANNLAPEDELMDNIGLRSDDNSAVAAIELTSFQVKPDHNLATILNELDGHVDSIQSNIGQVQGIAEAVTRSKAAVQATLFEHLERSEYEKVILG
ncbi:centromere protein Q [Bisporella sp. PMI_857]|nr:centromere protein Q [Bisporella sp. PMI_857]